MPEDSSQPPLQETLAAEPPAQRLSMIHLLGWMTASAVMLGAMWLLRRSQSIYPFGTFEWTAFEITFTIIRSAASGAALVGLFIWIARRVRKAPATLAPGGRLLAVMGAHSILWLVPGIPLILWVNYAFHDEALFETERVGIYASAFRLMTTYSNVTAAAVFFAAACVMRRPTRWGLLFAAIAIEELLQVAATWLFTFGALALSESPLGLYCSNMAVCLRLLAPAALLAVIAVVVAIDLRRSRHGGWEHWSGVCALFALKAVDVVYAVRHWSWL